MEFNAFGTWHSICADFWGLKEADVVCRELGFGYAISAVTSGKFGVATVKRYGEHFKCRGVERSILDCESFIGTCSGKMDAGVVCHNESAKTGSLRLSDLGNGYAGLVQVYINHTWGYVCDRDRKWTEFDAGVTCRQMGFDAVESHQTSPSFDSTHRAWLHSVMCFGGEKTLIQCQHGDLSLRSCNQSRLAAVLCYRYVPTTATSPPATPLTTEGIVSIACSVVAAIVIALVIIAVSGFVYWYRKRSSVTSELSERPTRRRPNLWSILYPSRRNSHPDPEVFSDEDAPPPTYNYPWYVKSSPGLTSYTESHRDEDKSKSYDDQPPPYIPLVNM